MKHTSAFGDVVHQNNSTHIDSGIEDEKELTSLRSNQYNLPKGVVGRRFLDILTALALSSANVFPKVWLFSPFSSSNKRMGSSVPRTPASAWHIAWTCESRGKTQLWRKTQCLKTVVSNQQCSFRIQRITPRRSSSEWSSRGIWDRQSAGSRAATKEVLSYPPIWMQSYEKWPYTYFATKNPTPHFQSRRHLLHMTPPQL